VRGFTLTLRQLFYQFVARSLIDDRQSEYKRLGHVINNGRRCRLIDWDAIEDRGRTSLDLDGGKIQRKFRPRRRRRDQARTQRRRDLGFHIGEGVETCLAALRLGLWPAWALGSAGAVAPRSPYSRGSNA
jgi:hypothetical protein